MPKSETHRAIEAVWRIEAAKLVAGLTRIVRDVGLAEELAQDALMVAIERWEADGIPDRPGAWLMATAKRRAIDYFRRNKMAARKLEELGRDLEEEEQTAPDYDTALDDDIGDDLLSLVFTACHPVLSMEARTALTLRLVGGLSTDEIARAFLVPEPTVAQRIVRAKRSLAEAKLPFEVPRGADRAARVSSVLQVIYLIFNEGYAATSGSDWIRPQLTQEALRLGRVLARLMPNEAEVHGLIALMEIQASRFGARVGPDGEPILLLDQNRARWDHLLIRRGLNALERAESLGPRGLYTLQAALAACHARAPTAAATDWRRIADLYEELSEMAPSPLVTLNRAVAVGMADGPEAGLALVDTIADDPVLRQHHLLPAVRADLLLRMGRKEEAREQFLKAGELTRNEREKQVMRRRADEAAATAGAA